MTMLDRMRRHQGWLKWSLGLVVLTFVFFYVPDFLSPPAGAGATSDAVATVQGRPISVSNFTRAYNAQMAQFRNAYGGNMSPAMLRQLGMDRQVLQQMIDQEAVLAEATRLGISATDAEVRERIVSIPAFQENGQFIGEQRYRQLLRLQRPPITAAQFEDEIRNSVILDKMRATLTEWITVSETEADAEYRRRNEKVSLELVSFPSVSFLDQVQVTDAEVAAFFEKGKETYRIGERRKVRYLLLDGQAIRNNITVPEQDIQRSYRQNIDQYSQPEQVRVSHILLNIEGQDEAAVKARAEDLLEADQGRRRLRGARQGALAGSGERRQGWRPRLLRQGPDGAGVRSRGLHAAGRPAERRRADALRVPHHEGDRQEGGRSAAARRRAAADFRAAEVRTRADAGPGPGDGDRRELKAPADLDKAAAKRGLKVQESPLFTRTEPIPGLGASPDVSEQAFTLETGKVSGPLRTGTGVAFLTVTGVEAARLPTLAEVKERVATDLKRQRAQELARGKAQATAVGLKSAADFQAAAKATGLDAAHRERSRSRRRHPGGRAESGRRSGGVLAAGRHRQRSDHDAEWRRGGPGRQSHRRARGRPCQESRRDSP